jgi:hypothetical protein
MRINARHAAKIMAKRGRISVEEYQISLSGLRYPELKENRLMLSGKSPALLPSAQRLATVMFENRLLTVAPDIKPIFDASYLKDKRP